MVKKVVKTLIIKILDIHSSPSHRSLPYNSHPPRQQAERWALAWVCQIFVRAVIPQFAICRGISGLVV
jgi:hypothetical protein